MPSPGVLKDAGVAISMDGKGRAMDNIMVERLWRSVKYEEIYLKEYEGVGELIDGAQAVFRLLQRRATPPEPRGPNAGGSA